jgi:hypothetical protein
MGRDWRGTARGPFNLLLFDGRELRYLATARRRPTSRPECTR